STLGMRWGYSKNILGGSADSVTATFGANVTFPCIEAREYSGLDKNAPFETGVFAGQEQTNPGTGNDAVSSGNMTPTTQPCLLIGTSLEQSNALSLAAGTGFTSRGGIWNLATANNFALAEDQRLTSLAAVAATFTSASHGGADKFFTCGAVFKEALATAERKTLSVNGTRTGSRGMQGGMSAHRYSNASKIFLPARMAECATTFSKPLLAHRCCSCWCSQAIIALRLRVRRLPSQSARTVGPSPLPQER